ncbi:hypothetical protein C8R43DRAFT_1143375 [Mycena crocata]|nr:hypothetical protein C8R43DRAFT_1143375 [Mycena crocata]
MTRSSSSSPSVFPSPQFGGAVGFMMMPMMLVWGGGPISFGGSFPYGGPVEHPAAPAPAKAPNTTPTDPSAAPPRTPPGAGLPAALVALLRTEGPYLANEVFSTPPTQPLAAVDEPIPAPEWYCITRGRFVGVVNQYALSGAAISGVAHGERKTYTTQNQALDAFNAALLWGGVVVV